MFRPFQSSLSHLPSLSHLRSPPPQPAAVHGVLVLLLVLASGTPALAAERDPTHGQWPLQPRPAVVDGFDPPASPWGAGHRGVDLRGSVGQLVRSARAGTVSFAGRIAGRGVVVVDHGSTRTTYEPVAAVVEVGDRVVGGERIGTLGLFGSHCFPRACLHWGLIEGEEYLDPLTLVGAGPVRLLPLFGRPAARLTAPTDPGPVPLLPAWRPVGGAQLFRG